MVGNGRSTFISANAGSCIVVASECLGSVSQGQARTLAADEVGSLRDATLSDETRTTISGKLAVGADVTSLASRNEYAINAETTGRISCDVVASSRLGSISRKASQVSAADEVATVRTSTSDFGVGNCNSGRLTLKPI